MSDGLDAAAQGRVLAAIAGRDYQVEELLRPSVVAPFVLKWRDVRSADPAAPAYGIDVYFVANGDLNTLAGKDFLDRWQSRRDDRKAHVLTADELAARKLVERSERDRQERYGHVVLTVLDRVQVSATLHAVTTRRPGSVLVASRVDPRFADDAAFPNRWRSVHRDDDGRPVLGPPHPNAGAGV
jgi:hypothetical protein